MLSGKTLANDELQKIDITLSHPDIEISNPFSQVTVTTLQNGAWVNAQTTHSPLFVQESNLLYTALDDNTFGGINEYRRFDARSSRFRGVRVANIVQGTNDSLRLMPDANRAFLPYTYDIDQNGRYFIRKTDGGGDPEIFADYVWVTFTLPTSQVADETDVYVYGQFTDYKVQQKYKLTYNLQYNAYQGTFLVKQGLYDFSYVLAQDIALQPVFASFEGNHYETENEYYVLVYFKDVRLRYEQLAAVQRFRVNGR